MRCDVLITEATFGMPIYRWRSGEQVAKEIHAWWSSDRNGPSCCSATPSAKPNALAELKAIGVEEEVLLHGAVETVTRHYREAGFR